MNVKNILTFFIPIIVMSVFWFMPKEGCRVFDIKSPVQIYVDENKNHIFDEKEPVKTYNFNVINIDTDYTNYPVLSTLTDEQKFFLNYKAKEYADFLLKNKYVELKNGEIYINGKSYKELMLESLYAFDDDIQTQQKLVDKVNSVNLDNYVIYNTKSKKYHKLNCPEGRKASKYKIKEISNLDKDAKPCKACHLEENKPIVKQKAPEIKKENPQKPVKTSQTSFEKENIKVFFIDLNKIQKPTNKCNSEACSALKREIENSKTSIDFAIYGINNQPELVNALINAKNRGVKIRWVYDVNKSGNYYEDNEELAKLFPDFKTDEKYETGKKSAIMHNKFFIFDNKRVWTGSANISTTDLSNFNANYAVLIESKDLANAFEEEFNKMYSGVFHKDKPYSDTSYIKINTETQVKPLFSPQHNIMKSEIIPIINNAKKYIYMPMFLITYKDIANALVNAHNRGVEIKVIHDATNSHADYSMHKMLREAGIKVKTENYAGKMHAKTIIVDDNISLIGSMNYTSSGNGKNDENVVIIKDGDIAKFLKGTFMYLWNKIPDKYEKFDPRAESLESTGSCYDGIDNNFDNKIDSEDEGCRVK